MYLPLVGNLKCTNIRNTKVTNSKLLIVSSNRGGGRQTIKEE